MKSSASDNAHPGSYSTFARLLHWLMAAMIVVQFVLAKLADRAEDAGHTMRQLGVLANHKSVGITILGLVVLRLIWRALHAPPKLPPMMPTWQVKASHLSHWSFYVLLFAVPISGWLMSSASAYTVSWFNLLQLPDLIAPDADLKHTFEDLHETLTKVLLVLAVVHVIAAFKHLIIDKDGVMRRMFSPGGGLIFIVVISAGVAVLGRAGTATTPAHVAGDHSPGTAVSQLSGSVSEKSAPPSTSPLQDQSALPVWNIDYATSYIRFTAEQAGADFTGEWRSWNAMLQFSKQALADSRFDVTIDTGQVDTRDAERDAALADVDWFDVANFPHAYYRANRFTAIPNDSFVANGSLTVKGQSFPVDLQFTVSESNGRRALEGTGVAVLLNGSAQLDRLKLRIGTGEWQDTSWVGQKVRVDVRVEAHLPMD